MGQWGNGPWENDAALDMIGNVVTRLLDDAHREIREAEDAVFFQTVIARIAAATVLLEAVPDHSDTMLMKSNWVRDAGLDQLAVLDEAEDDVPAKIETNRINFVSACDRLIAAVALDKR